MIQEFDQSAYNINSSHFYSTVYMTSDPVSDHSLSETDVSIIVSPTYSNLNTSQMQSSQHENISESFHTPVYVYNSPDQLREDTYFANDV